MYLFNNCKENCAFSTRPLVSTLFDMGFFWTVSQGGGRHHNFVIIALMIMKLGTSIKLDVFYTMVTKNCDVTSIT